jgi:23S rRNA (adenine2503-C2)-methyltransferase
MGLQRNLTAGEIVEQVLWFERRLAPEGTRLSNVVLMGMGEPLANYAAVLEAIRRMIDPQGLALGPPRITQSTLGLVPGIEKFTREDLQVNLAVSLHAATDELRDRIVPINRRYPLDRLLAAVQAYIARTHRRVSFEWALIAGVNDTPEQARALAARVKGMLCHVNVIPLNPTRGYGGGPSPRERVAAFTGALESAGIPVTVRVRRGIDINAGCGQLRTEHEAGSGER